MTISRLRLVAPIVAVLAIMAAFGPGARAGDSASGSAVVPSFLLEPVDQKGAYFEETLEPGETKKLKVALGNAGEAPARARTFVADAYTLVNGGFGVKNGDQPVSGTTTWLDYPDEILELPARQKIERTFKVTVPEGTAPGQYIAGLVLQTADPIAIQGTDMLRQIIRKAIAVFITVPGPVSPEMTIGQASVRQTGSATSLLIEIGNPGNVLLKPTGTVTMTTRSGDPVLTAPIEMGSVYAETSTSIELPIPTVLSPGDYVVSVELSDEATGVSAAEPVLSLTVIDPSTIAAAPPVTIESMTVDPSRDPASGGLQFVNVTVGLENTGTPVPSARLTMHVTRDGTLVEDFPLNSSLVVPSGPIEIQQRYIPLGSWAPGTYAFSVTLEAVDANSGQVTVLANAEASSRVTVP
jgi:hypothetical protein